MDFIKIDTEGYEENILKGAMETIKKQKPIIALSAYHKPNDREELPKVIESFAAYSFMEDGEDMICKPK